MVNTNELKVDRAAERRARVMEAARGLFVSRGFHAASTAQIADAAGIAVQQMYRDFGSKEGIVSAIVEKDVARLFATIDPAVAQAGESKDALRLWLQELIFNAIDPADGDLRAEIFAEGQRNEQIAKILAEIGERIRAAVYSVVSAYSPPSRSGEDLAQLTEILVGLITASGGQLQGGRTVPAQIIAARLASMLEREITGSPA